MAESTACTRPNLSANEQRAASCVLPTPGTPPIPNPSQAYCARVGRETDLVTFWAQAGGGASHVRLAVDVNDTLAGLVESVAHAARSAPSVPFSQADGPAVTVAFVGDLAAVDEVRNIVFGGSEVGWELWFGRRGAGEPARWEAAPAPTSFAGGIKLVGGPVVTAGSPATRHPTPTLAK